VCSRITHYIQRRGNSFCGRLVLIASPEGITGGNDDSQLTDPSPHRTLCAFFIEDEPDVGDILALRQPLHDRFSVRHLRHSLWVHEADCLDPAQPGSDEPLDESNLVACRDRDGFILQSIARTDLNELYCIRSQPQIS
jgi:hypothetical protein